MATRRVLPGLMQVLAAPSSQHPLWVVRPLPPLLTVVCPLPPTLLPLQVLAAPADFAPALTLKLLRTIKHLCMGDAKHMDELQRAKAIPHLVALLKGDAPQLVGQGPSGSGANGNGGGALLAEMRNQCVNALYLLCKINRSRQEEAAIHGVLAPLQAIITQGSPLKQFALPIVCDIAKASKRARAELKQHRGVPFYLSLLSVPYWQVQALDALLVWLQVLLPP